MSMTSRKVKLADLRVKDPETHQVVKEVLESGYFIGGPYVEKFARLWAAYNGAKHCVPMANGSAALTASLRALTSTSPGVLVHGAILPALSFAATALSVRDAGMEPIYVDVGLDGLMNTTQVLEMAERYGARIAIPVHLYGQLMEFSDEFVSRLLIVEDACQAHGALYRVQGDLACFSFYPAKNLGAVGDAGAVVTDRSELAEYIAMWSSYGDRPDKKYDHYIHGTNNRMDALQAAVLADRLERGCLSYNNEERFLLSTVYVAHGVVSFATTRPCVWHQYPILVRGRERFRAMLGEHGIDSAVHYPYILPEKVHGIVVDFASAYPNARYLATHALSLPMGPHLTDEDVVYVSETIRSHARLADDGVWELVD